MKPAFLFLVWVLLAGSVGAAPAVPEAVDVPQVGDVPLRSPVKPLHPAWEIRAMAADGPQPPAGGSPVARIAWNNRGLIVEADVRDSTPSESHHPAGAYQFDSVEFFLAPEPALQENVQAVVSPGHQVPRIGPRLYVFDNRPSAPQPPMPEIGYAVHRWPGGYRVRALLPWAACGIRPVPGLIVGTRLLVNDHDGADTRVRFSWVPEKARFHSLRLAKHPGPPVVSACWTAFDPASMEDRLLAWGPAAWAGRALSWNGVTVPFKPCPGGSSAMIALSPGAGGNGTVMPLLPDGSLPQVPNRWQTDHLAVLRDANAGWRLSPLRRRTVQWAGIQPERFVFRGSRFPGVQFGDPERVARLLGGTPEVGVRWFDHRGRTIPTAADPGIHGAHVRITLPSGPPLERRFILHRLPAGVGLPETNDEPTAQIMAFGLSGADATTTHAARVAERWWHGVLGRAGLAPDYPFGLRPPTGGPPKGGTKAPLLVYLHGTGFGGEGADARFFDRFSSSLASYPGYVLYPRASSPWNAPAVHALIDRVVADHPVDPAAIHLVGFSMGGIGGWRVLLDRPERFAAAAIIGGRSGEPTEAWRLASLPIRIINGAEDPTTTPEEAQIMLEALRRAGGPVEAVWLQGADHGPSMDRALSDPGLFRWLAAQRRTRQP